MSSVCQDAIRSIACAKYNLNRVDFRKQHIKDLFGVNVFNEAVQRGAAAQAGVQGNGERRSASAVLDPSVADAVASAMKDWALEHGATHFTHLFQPMTGITAEKHDSFLAPSDGGGDRGVQRARADQGRARRVELVRRPPRHLRGARVHGVGPDQPGLHRGAPQRLHAGGPDGVPELDGRGAGQETPCSARWTR